jgi:hypothetical protein
LQAALKISGKDHLFVGFDGKRSRAADGSVVNSISPRSISGGAVFDAGNLADPDNLPPNAHMQRRLAAIVIEYYPKHKRIVATRIRLMLDAICDFLHDLIQAGRPGCHIINPGRDAPAQLTAILRGLAFSALGSTKVMTPSFSSALMPSWSILLESWKLRA